MFWAYLILTAMCEAMHIVLPTPVSMVFLGAATAFALGATLTYINEPLQ